jgi:hypothetical protein
VICTCCNRELRIAECQNVRPWVCGDFLYALLAEHGCGSTRCFVLFEVPDDVLLVDGELSPMSHERDSREGEAA